MPGLLRFRYSQQVFHISVVFLVLCLSCFFSYEQKMRLPLLVVLLAWQQRRERWDNRKNSVWRSAETVAAKQRRALYQLPYKLMDRFADFFLAFNLTPIISGRTCFSFCLPLRNFSPIGIVPPSLITGSS